MSYAFSHPWQKIAREKEDPTLPVIHDLVAKDIEERRAFGIEKYKVPLQPFDGADNLKEAYQEALDLVIYLRSLIFERDNPHLRPRSDNSDSIVDESLDLTRP